MGIWRSGYFGRGCVGLKAVLEAPYDSGFFGMHFDLTRIGRHPDSSTSGSQQKKFRVSSAIAKRTMTSSMILAQEWVEGAFAWICG